jgi:hypothetical protein
MQESTYVVSLSQSYTSPPAMGAVARAIAMIVCISPIIRPMICGGARLAAITCVRSGVERSGVEWSRVEWSGGEWSGVEWSGVEWSGVEWSAVEWSGAEWSGVEWSSKHVIGRQVEATPSTHTTHEHNARSR